MSMTVEEFKQKGAYEIGMDVDRGVMVTGGDVVPFSTESVKGTDVPEAHTAFKGSGVDAFEQIQELLDEVMPDKMWTLSNGETRMTDPDTGGQKGVKGERFDLMPVWAQEEIARVFGWGATKYDDHNWRKGYKWGYSFGAMMRHAWAFWRGEDHDPESGLHHMAHVAWHCLVLMTYWKEKLGTDDRV